MERSEFARCSRKFRVRGLTTNLSFAERHFRARESAPVDTPPHPDPPEPSSKDPASGEREQKPAMTPQMWFNMIGTR
jgi:hypothetical protein